MTDERQEYDEIKALNYSTLKLMNVSPAYARHMHDHPEELGDKPAYVSGRAVHCASLEPKEFGSRYVVMPDFGNLRTKAARADRDAWLAELQPGVEVISQDDYDMALRCRDALYDNDEARGYMRGAIFETTVRWVLSGIQCKARIDILTDRIIDLKLSRRNELGEVERDMANFDYHAQLAWYHFGAVKAGLIDGKKMPVAIVVHASHKSTFVDVACFEMCDATLDLGRMHYQRLFELYVGCTELGIWPGMASRTVQWELPAWKTAQYEEF